MTHVKFVPSGKKNKSLSKKFWKDPTTFFEVETFGTLSDF